MIFSTPLNKKLAVIKTESNALLKVGLPIMMAQIAIALMGFTDTVMAGHLSAVDLAAVAIGTNIWFPVLVSLNGTLIALTPSIAHLRGKHQSQDIWPLVQQGIWIALGLILISFLLLRHADVVLNWFKLSDDIYPITDAYLNAIAFGIPAFFGFMLLRLTNEGLARPRPMMLISFLGLVLNISLNYILVYGKLGLPALGGAGCGWATACVYWFMFITAIIYMKRTSLYQQLGFFKFNAHVDVKSLWTLLKLGIPISGTIFVEVSLFALMSLLIGTFGAHIIAAHQATLNFASIMFMVPQSIATAITVRVGFFLGKNNRNNAKNSSQVGIGLALMFACFSASFILLFPEHIISFYTNDTAIKHIAVQLLLFAAIFQFSDALQVAAIGALRGYKDTQLTLWITIIAYWIIGLPLGYYFAFNADKGAAGLWIGVVIGLTIAAILLTLRLIIISQHNHARSHQKVPA